MHAYIFCSDSRGRRMKSCVGAMLDAGASKSLPHRSISLRRVASDKLDGPRALLSENFGMTKPSTLIGLIC